MSVLVVAVAVVLLAGFGYALVSLRSSVRRSIGIILLLIALVTLGALAMTSVDHQDGDGDEPVQMIQEAGWAATEPDQRGAC